LIIELGIQRGFSVALCAGAGAASADLIYATFASLAGTFVISILKLYSPLIHIASAFALIALGLWSLYRSKTVDGTRKIDDVSVSTRTGAYGLVLGLTLLNPLTVAYFTTLILGLKSNIVSSPEDIVLFVSGAFLASLSWQSVVASLGGFGHERLSPKLRQITFVIGNSIIILLGILFLLGFSI
jgi:threonine/homoserine/homoserine lactone efflux protein